MSTIKKLLEGAEVEWKIFWEIADYKQPTKYLVKTKTYLILTEGDHKRQWIIRDLFVWRA